MTPARRTEPAVGASTCASGSHVWNGTTGILTMNPKNMSPKTIVWNATDVPAIPASTAANEKFATPPLAAVKTMMKIPINITSDATWV